MGRPLASDHSEAINCRPPGETDESDLSASGINFDAPATFRKWPSLNGQRRIESAAAYLLVDGTLDAASGISWLSRFRATPLRNSYVTAATIGGRRSISGDRRRTRSPSRFSLIPHPGEPTCKAGFRARCLRNILSLLRIARRIVTSVFPANVLNSLLVCRLLLSLFVPHDAMLGIVLSCAMFQRP